MAGMHVKFDVTPEEFLAHLTEAAYQSILKHGFQSSFVEVELDLQDALREAMERDVLISESCGSGECLAFKKNSFEVWFDPASRSDV